MLRAPEPDFRLSVNPESQLTASDGCALTVTAQRWNGLKPISVSLQNLPAGLKRYNRHYRSETNQRQFCCHQIDAKLEHAIFRFLLSGTAQIAGKQVAHQANRKMQLTDRPDAKARHSDDRRTREVVLEPAAQPSHVTIRRQNGFAGRVPSKSAISRRGCASLMSAQRRAAQRRRDPRTFTLEALPSAEPVEQLIYVSGLIEDTFPAQNSHAGLRRYAWW